MKPPGGSVRSPFGAFATCVVSWEAAAVVTQDLMEAGVTDWRVPYITEVVRNMRPVGRVVFVGGVAFVLWEHLEYMRFTRRVLARCLGTQAPAH